MRWKSVFQEGDQTYSFGRVAAFLIVVVSQAMVGVALAKALAEPKIEWDAFGGFVAKVYESTAWLAASLYGIAKTSSVVGAFRGAQKGLQGPENDPPAPAPSADPVLAAQNSKPRSS